MILRRLGSAALVVALTAILPRLSSACEVTARTTVPLVLAAGRILVGVAVNGAPATFALDTGADRSLVTPEAARRLGLPRDRWVDATVIGIGGITQRSVADVRTFSLGGVPLRDRNAAGETILAMAPLGETRAGASVVDGQLGRDFLRSFDVALDGPARTMTLWQVRGCAGRFLPWRAPYDAIAALPAYADALVVPVEANGVTLRALPDTGTTETLIAAPGMARLALAAPANAPATRTYGIGRFARPVWPVHLSSLRVGDETIRDPSVLGSALRVFPIVDMLLAADWFRTRRVWLSYSTEQVFVSPGEATAGGIAPLGEDQHSAAVPERGKP